MRTHDAELCERIRELEARVAELEARPTQTVFLSPPHYCYAGCPTHYPSITWGGWSFSGTTSDSNGTQYTLTAGGTA